MCHLGKTLFHPGLWLMSGFEQRRREGSGSRSGSGSVESPVYVWERYGITDLKQL